MGVSVKRAKSSLRLDSSKRSSPLYVAILSSVSLWPRSCRPIWQMLGTSELSTASALSLVDCTNSIWNCAPWRIHCGHSLWVINQMVWPKTHLKMAAWSRYHCHSDDVRSLCCSYLWIYNRIDITWHTYLSIVLWTFDVPPQYFIIGRNYPVDTLRSLTLFTSLDRNGFCFY